MALKNYTSFYLLEEYLNYLTVIKGRSLNTVIEYRTDILLFFSYLKEKRKIKGEKYDLDFVDEDFIRSITLNDMYSFISYCQTSKNASAGTRARKIVSIRQFWKYLKTKAKVIDNNVSEELETPKIPKRMPKHLTLEESIRLLIECENNPRDHCIITMFLNCALRLSELTSINIEQVSTDSLRIIGKGNKERTIFLTPATKKAINTWLAVRKDTNTNALFISKNGDRLTGRAVQGVVKKYLTKAGLDIKSLSTHKLRHTAATLMYQYGKVDIIHISI
ncbi:MAG: tyrosine-type recombinase/integrase [Lachnospiraceae bacterium]